MTGQMVRVEQLSKNYGSKIALRDVSLDLPPGEVIGLIGQNGKRLSAWLSDLISKT